MPAGARGAESRRSRVDPPVLRDGRGPIIACFVPKNGSPPETRTRRQLGSLLHIALDLAVPIEEAIQKLDAEGHHCRGLVYSRDGTVW